MCGSIIPSIQIILTSCFRLISLRIVPMGMNFYEPCMHERARTCFVEYHILVKERTDIIKNTENCDNMGLMPNILFCPVLEYNYISWSYIYIYIYIYIIYWLANATHCISIFNLYLRYWWNSIKWLVVELLISCNHKI